MNLCVSTQSKKYDITIERGALSKVSSIINLNRKCLIVTDEYIPSDYIDILNKQCKSAYVYVIKHGEKSKNIKNYQNILTYLLENAFTRTDCIIALGGGVVGDLAGFVASTYMRGIAFYNIPTTVLSMVDSSIGGKTAIDYNGIKNIVGSFYQPDAVIIDPDTLNSLKKREFYAGLIEAIKMALCFDKDLFYTIYESKDLNKDIDEVIYRSLLIKRSVVEADEKENGLRKSLNFGHTIGHAIEAKYSPKYLHGEAVGMGMMYFSSNGIKEKLSKLLKKYHIPAIIDLNYEDVVEYIKHDKKASDDLISIIYVDEIGKFEIRKITIEELKKYFFMR